jgi:anti-sigma factor RsiW
MLYTAILDHRGLVANVKLGFAHGNVKYAFTIEAERLVDAQEEADRRCTSEFERIQAERAAVEEAAARPKPGPKPKEPRCRCSLPVAKEGDTCRLCRNAVIDNALRRAGVATLPVRVAKPDDEAVLLLLEVQQEWRTSSNNGRFTKWLDQRIADLRARE